MPWKESDAMKERTKFVLEWERRLNEGDGQTNVAQLCREFGISRETGYVWLRRFREGDHDIRALEERSRRPLTSPTAFDEDTADVIAAARKRYPQWGPRKLYVWLCERRPDIEIPKPATVRFGPVHIGHLDEQRLERGLILPKRTRPRVSGMSSG